MKIVQQKIYEYSELTEKVKNNLLEKEKEDYFNEYCESCLYYDIKYKAEELLQEYFGDRATMNQIWYDLGYCQGDYACIDFELKKNNGDTLNISQCGRGGNFEIKELYRNKQTVGLYDKIEKMFEELRRYGYDCLEYTRENTEYLIERLEEHEYYLDGSKYSSLYEYVCENEKLTEKA